MIVTYPDGDPSDLPTSVNPRRLGFNVADPPQAEERIEWGVLYPDYVNIWGSWWYLPKVNELRHMAGWKAEPDPFFVKQHEEYKRTISEMKPFQPPKWLLRKWENRPWWCR